MCARQGLASASLRLGRLSRPLGDAHRGEGLRCRRVNSDGFIEVEFRRAASHRDGHTLRHLARIRAAHVKADDALLIGGVNDQPNNSSNQLVIN